MCFLKDKFQRSALTFFVSRVCPMCLILYLKAQILQTTEIPSYKVWLVQTTFCKYLKAKQSSLLALQRKIQHQRLLYLVPLAIIYFAGNHCVGVSTPQIIAEVRQSILYLNCSKISMVDAGHIKQQSRMSCCSDFKFNCKSENQMNRKTETKEKIFGVRQQTDLTAFPFCVPLTKLYSQ